MYAGHFACAVALHGARPHTPAWIPFLGIGFVDLLNGIGVAAGVAHISPDPGVPLGVSLDYIDWDHSLLMSVAWALLFGGAVAWKWGRGAGVVGAAAVASHFVMDVIVHNGDLALWPGSAVKLGLYLWQLFPVGSWFVELAIVALLSAIGIALGWRNARIPPRAWRGVLVMLAVLQVSFLPPFSAVRMAGAHLDGRALDFTYAALLFVGFLVPAWIACRLAPRPRATDR